MEMTAGVTGRLWLETLAAWIGVDALLEDIDAPGWTAPALVLAGLLVVDVPVLTGLGSYLQGREPFSLGFYPWLVTVPAGLLLAFGLTVKLRGRFEAAATALPVEAAELRRLAWVSRRAALGLLYASALALVLWEQTATLAPITHAGPVAGAGKSIIILGGYVPMLADLVGLFAAAHLIVPLGIDTDASILDPEHPSGIPGWRELEDLLVHASVAYFGGLGAGWLLLRLHGILDATPSLGDGAFWGALQILPLLILGGLVLFGVSVVLGHRKVVQAREEALRQLASRPQAEDDAPEVSPEVRRLNLRLIPSVPASVQATFKVVLASTVPLLVEIGV